MGQTNNTRKQPILSRPFIPEGNDFEIMIDMKKADTEEYIDYDLTTCKNIVVYLTCGAHGTEIPLQYTIVDNHKLQCPVNHGLLHANTSYGIVVEGDTDEDKHWQYTIMPREGIAIIPNTSGEVIPDGTTTIDIQGRVGFIGAVGPQGPPGTTDYNELENKPDLSIYATKTELDNKQDTLESGINIKTINNESILGSGNIDIQGGGGSVEPIIVNYREVIPDETITKIKEQKTNVWMKIGEQYYLLTDIRTMDGWGATLTFIVPSPKSKVENGDVVDNGQIYVQIFQYFEIFKKWFNKSYTVDDHSKIENLFNEQFKTTADALWDLDHRINRSEYITNKKLESVENSTKETLDEFGDNINEQLSVAANTLMEHSERLAVQSDWNESDSSSLAYIQNKPSIPTPVQSDWNESDSSSLAYIQNKPTIQPQVQSDWNESDSSSLAYIQNKPTIATPVQSDWNESDTTSLAYIQNKPTIATPVQSDWNESDSSSLAYIQNKPTISTPVQSDWNESDSSSLAYIQNKPTIQTPVQSDWNESDSSSLAYIQNKPTIQTPVQSDWNETDITSLAYIQNKPTIQTPVQSDWNESDTTSLAYIQNKPTISTPVQSDWNETDTTSLAYIQNKPTIPTQAIDQYIIDANYDSINKRLYFRFATCIQDANGTIYEPNRLYEAPRIFAEIKNNRNLVYTLYTNNNSININSFLSSIVRSGRDHYLPIPTTIDNITIDEGTILNFRINTFSPWQAESHQNIYITIPKTGLVTSSTTAGLKIEVVSALPSTVDQNTIYIVQ